MKIELRNEQEVNAFVQLIDLGVKAGGINVATIAAIVGGHIQAQSKPKEEVTEESE